MIVRSMLASPDGWESLCAVASNFDAEGGTRTVPIDLKVVESLLAGGCVASHSAWDFHGLVWCNVSGQWFEMVMVHQVHKVTLSGDSLEELLRAANDEFGWA